jgi:hypothetical protein
VRKILFAIMTLVLVGCTNVKYKAVGDKLYTPKSQNYVMLIYFKSDATPSNATSVEHYLKDWGATYLPITNLKSEYDLIGYIRSSGAALANKKKILKKAINQARQLGADAMIIKKIGYVPVNMGSRGDLDHPVIFADAIRFKGE